jgi:hypothetical protein
MTKKQDKKVYIDKLTPEQEAKLPEYRDKWIKIGLGTKTDKELAAKHINECYVVSKFEPPKEILFVESPKAVLRELDERFGIKKEQALLFYGNFEAGWASFYDYCINETEIQGLEPSVPFIELIKQVSITSFLDKMCIASELPKFIKLQDKRLHCTTGPAIEYKDGFNVFALNGIRMKEEYVMTPADQMSVKMVMTEENVDVRRELLRKIGLERFVRDTRARELDKYTIYFTKQKSPYGPVIQIPSEARPAGDFTTCVYQLLEIDLGGDFGTARVLKMDNPSINAMHVEGVEDTCNTVKEALAWREGLDKFVLPKQLT